MFFSMHSSFSVIIVKADEIKHVGRNVCGRLGGMIFMEHANFCLVLRKCTGWQQIERK